MIIGIVVVIILSGLIYVQNFSQGTADLSITSSIAEPSSFNGLSNAYTLIINLHVKFIGQMTVTGYLNECSFHPNLNSTIWNAIPLICTGIIGSHSYSGSHDFTIKFWIVPKNGNSTISTPFNLSFNVFSNEFNVNSQYYNLLVTNSSELQASLMITHASLNNFTKQDGSTGFNINTTFSLTSNHSFNVTYGCSSPFTMELVNFSTWTLAYIDCAIVLTHYLPTGTSEYSLLYQLIPVGLELNSTPPLPSNFYIQVILGNYFLKSNVYTLVSNNYETII